MSSFEERTAPTDYVVGVASLDAQHRELHDIIGELSVFPHESILSLRAQRLLKEVWRCSFDHFRDEERLMVERGILPMDFGSHVADHARGLNRVAKLWSAQYRCVKTAPDAGQVYCELAEYWRRHIVEHDLTMATSWGRGTPVDRGFW